MGNYGKLLVLLWQFSSLIVPQPYNMSIIIFNQIPFTMKSFCKWQKQVVLSWYVFGDRLEEKWSLGIIAPFVSNLRKMKTGERYFESFTQIVDFYNCHKIRFTSCVCFMKTVKSIWSIWNTRIKSNLGFLYICSKWMKRSVFPWCL